MYRPRVRPGARHVLTAASAAALTGLACGGCGTGGFAAPPAGHGRRAASQAPRVEAAAAATARALWSLGSPPASYTSRELAAIRAGRTVSVVPAAERRRLLASGQAAITGHFTPAGAAQAGTMLADDVRADGLWNVVSSPRWVSRIEFTAVSVHGRTARVTADVTEWTGASAARQTSTSQWLMMPAGSTVESDTMTLARQPDGRWLVSSFVGACVRACP